jgi:hypothetical protein
MGSAAAKVLMKNSETKEGLTRTNLFPGRIRSSFNLRFVINKRSGIDSAGFERYIIQMCENTDELKEDIDEFEF